MSPETTRTSPFASGDVGRIPAAGVHVGALRPLVGLRVEDRGLNRSVAVPLIVAAGDEQAAVGKKRLPAQKGCTYSFSTFVNVAVCGIADPRFELGHAVLARPRKDSAVRKQRRVNGDKRPVLDRRPFADHCAIGSLCLHDGRTKKKNEDDEPRDPHESPPNELLGCVPAE